MPEDSRIRSGPEIVAEFVAQLRNDTTLDPATVEATERLFRQKKLNFTNLLKALEEARGKTAI
jgi:hypothetical protein